MTQTPDLMSPTNRPDLEEFVSALGGFLEKRSTPSDPNYERFLSMFCRSVGASEGHFLMRLGMGSLNSVTVFGLKPSFNSEFNSLRKSKDLEPGPQDMAFSKKEVVAIVEIEKDKTIPNWFRELMKKYQFQSVVAVPLLGRAGALGILCAYYKDVCLFDRNTLDHLMLIGRMIGTATEQSLQVDSATSADVHEKIFDNFLELVTTKQLTPPQIFQALGRLSLRHAGLEGVVCGPVKRRADAVIMEVQGHGGAFPEEPDKSISLPISIIKRLLKTDTDPDGGVLETSQWGSLKTWVGPQGARLICLPFYIQKKLLGVLVGWRKDKGLSANEKTLLVRLTRVGSLALNLVTKN